MGTDKEILVLFNQKGVFKEFLPNLYKNRILWWGFDWDINETLFLVSSESPETWLTKKSMNFEDF